MFTKIAAVTECDHLPHVIHFEHDFILLLIFGVLKQPTVTKIPLLEPLQVIIDYYFQKMTLRPDLVHRSYTEI